MATKGSAMVGRYTIHCKWTDRITQEFWAMVRLAPLISPLRLMALPVSSIIVRRRAVSVLQGDKEKAMGLPISPLCDREADSNIAKSQAPGCPHPPPTHTHALCCGLLSS